MREQAFWWGWRSFSGALATARASNRGMSGSLASHNGNGACPRGCARERGPRVARRGPGTANLKPVALGQFEERTSAA